MNRAIGAARSRRSKGLYKARHLVEDFVAKLKQYRAVAPGQDERPAHFLGAIYLTGIATWLIGGVP